MRPPRWNLLLFESMLGLLLLFLLGCSSLPAQTVQEWIQQGTEAYKAAQFDEAIDSFRQAVAADPQSVKAHLYLATAYLADLYTTAQSDEDKSRKAQQEFARVLELDPKNVHALSSLATLGSQRADAAAPADKPRLLDESRQWCLRLLEVNPDSKEAHYTLGVIAWSKFHPACQAARARAGLKPGDPGPLKDAKLRAALRTEWEPVLQDGIAHLQRAVELDPRYVAAMSYLNLLIRDRADLAEHPYIYQAEITKADAWVKRAAEARRQASGGATEMEAISLPPPPLPDVR